MNTKKNKFICPECGSKKIKEYFHYHRNSENSLYSKVLHEIQCASCFMDIPDHLGERHKNISIKEAKNEWINKYRPEHLKEAAKCNFCNLYYYEIEKKLELSFSKNKNIFMQKLTKIGSPDLICRICKPDDFE